MSFWKRTVIAGKCKEVKKYYSRMHKPKEKRIKRAKPTREAQEKINIRKQTEGQADQRSKKRIQEARKRA